MMVVVVNVLISGWKFIFVIVILNKCWIRVVFMLILMRNCRYYFFGIGG